MTLNDLEQDLYRRLGFNTSSVDSATQTRIRALLNETQNEIFSEPWASVLKVGTLTFASVANTPTYALPQAAATIKELYETTNDRQLWPRGRDWYRANYPDVTAVTGTPEFYVDLGLTSISVQPSDASSIFVDSTAAGDTGTAFLEGYRTGGYFVSKSVTMTGTTAVNMSAAISDWLWLTKFYISAAAVGTVTLTEDAEAGTELARIPIGQTFARYRRIALVPTPSSAITYTVDFDYDVPDMANAKDEPILPPRFHRLLGVGARMREYEKQDQMARYKQAQAEYLFGLKKLRYYAARQAAQGLSARGQRHERVSQLGGWFAAGT